MSARSLGPPERSDLRRASAAGDALTGSATGSRAPSPPHRCWPRAGSLGGGDHQRLAARRRRLGAGSAGRRREGRRRGSARRRRPGRRRRDLRRRRGRGHPADRGRLQGFTAVCTHQGCLVTEVATARSTALPRQQVLDRGRLRPGRRPRRRRCREVKIAVARATRSAAGLTRSDRDGAPGAPALVARRAPPVQPGVEHRRASS